MYRLGSFVLDVRHQLLLKDGQRVNLAKKPYGILVFLVQNRDRLVTRPELLERFWDGKDVYDQTLTRAVARIRAALGEAREEEHFIETRWASGYQYVGPFEPYDRNVLQPSIKSPDPGIPAAEIPPVPPSTHRPASLAHTAAAVSVIVAVVLSLAAGRWVLARRHRASQAPPVPLARSSAPQVRRAVAILPFRNLVGDPSSDWLGTALAEMLSTDLARDNAIRTLPGETVVRGSEELHLRRLLGLSPATLSAVNRDLNTSLVVTGAYLVLNPGQDGQKRVRVDVMVQDSATGEQISSFSQTGRFERLFELTSAAASRLLASIDPKYMPGALRAAAGAIPNNTAAFQDYMKGLDNLRAQRYLLAQPFLEKAIAEDSSFPLAHEAMADVWGALGYQEKERSELKAADGLSKNLDREHRLLIQARYATAIAHWDEAVEIYRALYTFFPDNVDYGLGLADVQIRAGRPLNSEATLQSLRRLPSPLRDDPRIDLEEASAAQALSDAPGAMAATQRAMLKAKRSGALLLYARALSMHAGNIAATNLRESIAESEQVRQLCAQFKDLSCVAQVLRRVGVFDVDTNPDQATVNLRSALAIARQIGNLTEEDNDLNGLAAIAADEGDYRSADVLYREMLAHARQTGSYWDKQMALNNLGDDLYLEGDLPQAKQMQEEALAICRQSGLRIGTASALVALSQIQLVEGDVKQARAAGTEAASLWAALQAPEDRAVALSVLGDVERTAGNLSAARSDLAQALAVLARGGDGGDLAHVRLAMARLNLDTGNPNEAIRLASSAADGFFRQKRPVDEGSAHGLLALARLAIGDPVSAGTEMNKALSLIHREPNQLASLDIQIDAALFAARAPRSAVVKIDDYSRQMRQIRLQAERNRCELVALEALLAYAELEGRRGRLEESRKDIERVKLRAKESGYLSLATEASADLVARQPSQKRALPANGVRLAKS